MDDQDTQVMCIWRSKRLRRECKKDTADGMLCKRHIRKIEKRMRGRDSFNVLVEWTCIIGAVIAVRIALEIMGVGTGE